MQNTSELMLSEAVGEGPISGPAIGTLPGQPAKPADSSDHAVVADGGSVPAWFQRRRERLAEQRGTAEQTAAPPIRRPRFPKRVLKHVKEPEERSPWELSLAWLLSSAGRAYVVSGMVHCVVFLALSVVIAKSKPGAEGINTLLVSNSQELTDKPGFDETLETRIDLPGGQSAGELRDTSTMREVVSNASTTPLPDLHSLGGAAESKSTGTGNGAGEKTGNGHGGGGFAMPTPGKAVTKGSFTAWTVPEDPQPGEDYLIIIQVKLTNSRQKLKKGDVTGTVVGTDGFRRMVSPFTSTFLPKSNQFVVPIPGADENVRDTIRIRSQILKESQQLEIVF